MGAGGMGYSYSSPSGIIGNCISSMLIEVGSSLVVVVVVGSFTGEVTVKSAEGGVRGAEDNSKRCIIL